MSDIQIAGATYNDVPSILVPKVGGGFAEYTEGGGGGGTLKPFVLRPDAELVQRWEYDKLIVEDEGVTLPAYSTSTKTLKASGSFSKVTVSDDYEYYLRYCYLATPIYSSDTIVEGRSEFCANVNLVEASTIPAGTINIGGIKNSKYRRYNAAPEYVYTAYWYSGAIRLNAGAGGPRCTHVAHSSSGNNLTVSYPRLQISGNVTLFSSAAWAMLTDIRYQYLIELRRAPVDVANHGGWELQQNMLHLINCWDNGGKLT